LAIAFKKSTDMSVIGCITQRCKKKHIVNRNLRHSPEHKHRYALYHLPNYQYAIITEKTDRRPPVMGSFPSKSNEKQQKSVIWERKFPRPGEG